jgi:hypothetical protein
MSLRKSLSSLYNPLDFSNSRNYEKFSIKVPNIMKSANWPKCTEALNQKRKDTKENKKRHYTRRSNIVGSLCAKHFAEIGKFGDISTFENTIFFQIKNA